MKLLTKFALGFAAAILAIGIWIAGSLWALFVALVDLAGRILAAIGGAA